MGRKIKKTKKKFESKLDKDLNEELNTLNSIFNENLKNNKKPITETEIFTLSDEEKKDILENYKEPSDLEFDKKNKTSISKIFNFIKNHVKLDVGLTPFKEGEGPDLENDNYKKIGEKLKENAKIGLKFIFKF